jgi:hypothetical protein
VPKKTANQNIHKMKLSAARELRDKYKSLIGQPMKGTNTYQIFDVIVTPDDCLHEFIIEYRNCIYFDGDSDTLINAFPSKEYSVKVIIDDNMGMNNIMYDDINEYLNMEPPPSNQQ